MYWLNLHHVMFLHLYQEIVPKNTKTIQWLKGEKYCFSSLHVFIVQLNFSLCVKKNFFFISWISVDFNMSTGGEKKKKTSQNFPCSSRPICCYINNFQFVSKENFELERVEFWILCCLATVSWDLVFIWYNFIKYILCQPSNKLSDL